MSISFEQLTLFPLKLDKSFESELTSKKSSATAISTRLLDSFGVVSIPFLGCDFDTIYPELKKQIPSEKITFDYDDINTLVACETVCSAICHQMNWDFLRQAVHKKTLKDPDWLEPKSLVDISESEIENLLASYNKPERIRANERMVILRQVGNLAKRHGSFANIFFESNRQLLPEVQIRQNLLECPVFSQDPEEKKLQLLLQKLSNYPQLSGLTVFCKPAVDYHLIRCFLRRGLLFPKAKLSKEFLMSTGIQRRESTVGALRKLCGDLVQEISNYTGLSVNSVNQIEWHVGRSICKEGEPDCYLKGPDSGWACRKYSKCPFCKTCCALNFNHDLLHIEEPTYLGTSY